VKHQPLKYHESVLVFSKSTHTYNPILRKNATGPFGRKVRDNKSGHIKNLPHTGREKVGYPKSILEFARPNNLTGGGLHPTQKPQKLMEYMVETYSQANDLILDFAMGSGTTLVAAKQLGRKAIGIEIEEKYVKIAIERLRQEVLPFS
jgi:site-specific DNA-methyltransferase (adenine-specific)